MTRSMGLRLWSALTLTVLLLAGPATAFETYKVTGVAAGDRLIVRDEPQDGGKLSDWAQITSLSADATNVLGSGRSKLVNKQRWVEVVVGPATGWVSERFLAAADDPVDLKGQTFQCGGTEPFWGVTLGPKVAEMSDPDSRSKLTVERVQPSVARMFPLLYRMRNEKGQSVRATVTHQQYCSDGMSDYDYAFQVLLSDEEELWEGCCWLQR